MTMLLDDDISIILKVNKLGQNESKVALLENDGRPNETAAPIGFRCEVGVFSETP
jgi:hypothetical protein